mmetsp:Transcript_24348/g.57095  ORF Transcript_24348/g.57095 Transcript_24348/m.57095 type:complete len:631 (+) Transcript_24348:44-1936(+)
MSSYPGCPYRPSGRQLQKYLTLVPRGLEDVASSAIREALTSRTSYACHNLQVLTPRHETEEYVQDMMDKLKKQQAKKLAKEQRRKKWMNNANEGDNKPPANDDKESAEKYNSGGTYPVIGTIQTSAGEHVSFGHRNGQAVMCKPGPFEGLTPLTFETDAPPKFVAGIRGMGCGPLLALVASSHLGSQSPSASADASTIFGYDQTAEEALASASAFVGTDAGGGAIDEKDNAQFKFEYLSRFRQALSLWFDHAEHVWYGNNGEFYGVDMADPTNKYKANSLRAKRSGDTPLSFRVSCCRTHSKRYKHWRREDIMAQLADLVVPSGDLEAGKEPWKVDLTKHDFEVLIMIHDAALIIGIVLRPYQAIGSKTYSNGTLPPDILPPFIKCDSGAEVVRLRPSTAALLLHLAKVKPGDIVLDPCAGLGTIPVEAALNNIPCVGMGGDVALRIDSFARLVTKYLKGVKNVSKTAGSGAATFAIWDAALLPIRDGIIDCIISDLPFGSKCLSTSKLQRFLPLLISECARILRPGGRIVFLCGAGSYQNIKDIIAIQRTVSGSPSFRSPSAVFPANIGGFIAWVVIVERGEGIHVRGTDHLDKVRAIASISKKHEKDAERKSVIRKQTRGAKFRRVQS